MENYFNYFTEVEECFRKCRGTPTLLSTLDWALLESWKDAGIPLDAVRAGIERAFQKFAKRRPHFQKVNGLAYCAQTVLQAAEEWNAGGLRPGCSRSAQAPAPFPPGEVRSYLARNAAAVAQAALRVGERDEGILAADLKEAQRLLQSLAASTQESPDFEQLEWRLSALEDKLGASLTRAASVELMTRVRGEFERSLARHRHSLTVPQIETLQRQYLKKALFDHYGVPRLSLFYL